MAQYNGMNRAERFEDEKRRIIDSCFSKKDEDGSTLETYITHLRITEYSSHPTTPPPPQARSLQNEKPRVIIVAVRKSGRVRVHKTKENVNGTFSIGKTWNLDDLAAIESFTGPNVAPDFRQWAGEMGFIVTLGKPYYWQAQTEKEKKFFIASLIKIFGKYTGGRVPALSNFDQRELDQVLGGASRRGGSSANTPRQGAPSPHRPPPSPGRPPPPSPGRPPLPDGVPSSLSTGSGYSGRNGIPPEYARTPSRGPMVPNGHNSSPSPSVAPSVDSARNYRNADHGLGRLANANKSQDSVAASYRSNDESLRPRSRGKLNGNGTSAYSTPEPPPALAPAFAPAPSPKPEERPPERKRPPMDPSRPVGMPPDESLVPAPLSSGARRDASREPSPVAPPPRSVERMSPRKVSRGQRPEAPSIDELSVKPPEAPAPVDAAPANHAPKDIPAESIASQPTTSTPAPETPVESPIEPEEDSRPGLGPMIRAKKSRDVLAGALWKAATAAGAFKPRAGGAGERLLKAAREQKTDEPDGIHAVVPAPPRPKSAEKPEPVEKKPEVPEVKVTVPNSSRPPSIQTSVTEAKLEVAVVKEPTEANPKEKEKEERKRSVAHGNDLKYLATLGVDPSVLDSKTTEFTGWLDYFSWVPGDKMRSRNFEEIKVDIDRELNKAQAGGWLARFQEDDERVDTIKKGIDVAIDECEELDNLLTLYSVELSTLQDDIAYIEAQGQGLQVQAANQKLLRKELESLLDTCAISADDLQPLSTAPLETAQGVEEIEGALVTLFKAMMKIDPSMGTGEAPKTSDASSDQAIDFNGDYAKMRIVQEKKEMYLSESAQFMRRLIAFMAKQFDEAFAQTTRAMEGALSKKVDPRNHEKGRDMLWKYGPLMLYARDVDLENWNRVVQIYQEKAAAPYKSEFREAVDAWKRNARKSTGDEKEVLFTYVQEKKEEGQLTTVRKLTVKRSQTLARTFRSPLGDGSNRSEKNLAAAADSSRSLPYEAFAGVLDDLLPLVEMEQNFIVDFFHATTLEQLDFPDAVSAVRPRDRRGNDLRRHRLMEPDRDLARRVTRSMETIFAFLEKDLGGLVDWVLGQDALQGVGVLANLERKLADISQSNQDFLNTILQKIHGNLLGRFGKFVEEQIRAIEETKVKIKKRKGVISFMRVFPHFSTAVENMMSGIDPALGVRRTIDREYDRLLKTMFDSLKVIAREGPAAGGGGGPGAGGGSGLLVPGVVTATAAAVDPEDKEALNFHILLIENMNHYIEEVDTRGLVVLEEWKAAAEAEMAEHTGLYLAAVMRRPLGRLLDHLENAEAQLAGGKAPAAVAAQPSNSRAAFNKVLGAYDAREVRKGVEALRKRVEKHFDENAGLAASVTRACERFYGEVEGRIGDVVTHLYGGDVLFEWPRLEVKNAFR